jgi:hypothetical protein
VQAFLAADAFGELVGVISVQVGDAPGGQFLGG